MRKIIHIDMDAFYAAVEQRDAPELRGLPIAVGGGGPRGVVMTASYEARTFGVRSAMPSVTARRLCPDLLFVPARFDAYKAASAEIRSVFQSYSDLVEPLSLDEAFVDVTEPKRGPGSATGIAKAIKAEIRECTQLTASAGVSFNKFLAKIASDLDKPDGLSVIRPDEAPDFIASLRIERFHGVGPATARRMKARGIHTGADLQALAEADLVRSFGKVGRHFWRIANGIDDRPVRPHRERKSVGAERTFFDDIADPEIMLERLVPLAERVAERLGSRGGRTVTLKIKHADFTIATRSRTCSHEVSDAGELMDIARDLLITPHPPLRPVRLLGITVSNFPAERQLRQLELEL